MGMGVRTKTIKKSARNIIEKYYQRLTLDFHTNKRIVDEVAILPSKRMRNKIAGDPSVVFLLNYKKKNANAGWTSFRKYPRWNKKQFKLILTRGICLNLWDLEV